MPPNRDEWNIELLGRMNSLIATLESTAQALSNILVHVGKLQEKGDHNGDLIDNVALPRLKDESFGLGAPMLLYRL